MCIAASLIGYAMTCDDIKIIDKIQSDLVKAVLVRYIKTDEDEED